MKSKASTHSETSSSTVPTIVDCKLRINNCNWSKEDARDKHLRDAMLNKVHSENNLITKSSHSTGKAPSQRNVLLQRRAQFALTLVLIFRGRCGVMTRSHVTRKEQKGGEGEANSA